MVGGATYEKVAPIGVKGVLGALLKEGEKHYFDRAHSIKSQVYLLLLRFLVYSGEGSTQTLRLWRWAGVE